MIEKSLIALIFMYAVSFGLLGGQYVMDVFGITMTNWEGTELSSNILSIIDVDNLNSVTSNLVTLNGTQAEADPVTAAAGLVVDLVQLMTGTYIFNILFLFGVPAIFIYGFTVIFAIMLFRTLIAYLRGI